MRRRPLQQRRPLRRGGPIQRKTALKRNTPLRPCNPARRARLYDEQFGPARKVIVMMPCATCGAPPPSEPSHVKTRGAGGSLEQLIPQCPACHDAFHDLGIETFQREMEVDLWDLVPRYAFLARVARASIESEGEELARELLATVGFQHRPF